MAVAFQSFLRRVLKLNVWFPEKKKFIRLRNNKLTQNRKDNPAKCIENWVKNQLKKLPELRDLMTFQLVKHGSLVKKEKPDAELQKGPHNLDLTCHFAMAMSQ